MPIVSDYDTNTVIYLFGRCSLVEFREFITPHFHFSGNMYT